MVVDAERVLLRLKAHLHTKRSHGADELLLKIAEIEVDCEIPEDEEAFDSRPSRSAVRDESTEPARMAPAV